MKHLARLLLVLSASASAAATLTTTTAALANSIHRPSPRCSVESTSALAAVEGKPPTNPITVPANSPAIVLRRVAQDATIDALNVRVEDASASTSASAGHVATTLLPEPVVTRRNELLVLLSQPLVVNNDYRVSIDMTCTSTAKPEFGSPVNGPSTLFFRTTEPVPLPTEMGTVAVAGDRPRAYPKVSEQLATNVNLTPTDGIDAFRTITRFTISVDDRSWIEIPYGELIIEKPNPHIPHLSFLDACVRVSGNAICGDRSLCGAADGKGSVRIGRDEQFDFKLHAHVAGTDPSTDPPPVSFRAPIDCANRTILVDEPHGCHVTTSSSSKAGTLLAFASAAIFFCFLGRRRRRRHAL